MAAEVSMNLQSNTAAHAQPSARSQRETHLKGCVSNKNRQQVCESPYHWSTLLCAALDHTCSPPGWSGCAGQDRSDGGLFWALKLSGTRPGPLWNTTASRRQPSACTAPGSTRQSEEHTLLIYTHIKTHNYSKDSVFISPVHPTCPPK